MSIIEVESETRARPEEVPLARGHTILCVDDERPVLDALRRLLRREPYTVQVAENARQALRLLDDGRVSLVLADQRMPEMLGTELLAEVRRRHPRMARVLMTGYPANEAMGAAQRVGIQKLISKPWDDDELRRTIRRLLSACEQEEDGAPSDAGDFDPFNRSDRDLLELALRLDCGRRPALDLLGDVFPLLEREETSTTGLFIIALRLEHLEDSVTSFLKTLAHVAAERDVRLGILDRSGLVGAFLAELREPCRIEAHRFVPLRIDPLRVLGIDERASNRALWGALLEWAGHPFRAAATADAAIRMLDAESFDRIWLDLDLPEGQGFEVLQHLLNRRLDIPVTAFSARLNQWGEQTFARLGIARRCAKPYAAKALVRMLEVDPGIL
jgi:CheY-like chemotaxis protein